MPSICFLLFWLGKAATGMPLPTAKFNMTLPLASLRIIMRRLLDSLCCWIFNFWPPHTLVVRLPSSEKE